MKSIAQNHFPQFIFRDGVKLLWNPVLKKPFVDLPEERVRLQIIEYLILEAGFSSSRISFESPVNLPRDKSASRTDVICYDKNFNPFLLIECKAPEITLNEKASVQIARYNQKVEAPFLLVSNGIDDYWFNSQDGSIKKLHVIPEEFKATSDIKRDFEYWRKRGFIGGNSHPDSRKWIIETCNYLYGSKRNSKPTYFKFDGSPKELFLANYYSVFELNKSTRLAISLSATPFGATRLNCVLNKNGTNTALFSSSLDLVATNDSKNTTIQSSSGVRNFDLNKELKFNLRNPVQELIEQISALLNKY
ncbi:MAG: type I restriction enzyme HsdR N-terminal domain-containing protein [Balneola sp.]